ncbi:MAG TPA: helix-turn-helix domain-containing protein [Puia sp.]|uniref:helix-turn-helix domain-containing protein n=1 Tax=Puia sp. TaxID=2045100 RepID=UPI002BE9938E|nr:helix-turn-helix domain-containing protein [Puia sp.]HVU93751.1 helix-turn-helix domain-containing protein [Puia sp.]
MNVICIQEDAFYALLDNVCQYVDKKLDKNVRKWISEKEAMQRLNVKSNTTLQKFRNEGRIRFSQPEKKIILYDLTSIDDYLEKNARGTF